MAIIKWIEIKGAFIKRVYVGPLWGHFPSLLTSSDFIKSHEVVFFGGFQFFNYQTKDTVDQLIHLTDKSQNVKMNRSRFEESFLVLAGLAEEKNYHFRHWLNPFSGILSAVESYGMSAHQIVKSPASAGDELSSQIRAKEHFRFYQSLLPKLINENVEKLIEKSISDRTSFQNISIYDEAGKIVAQESQKPQLLQNYINQTLMKIDQISQELYEKRN